MKIIKTSQLEKTFKSLISTFVVTLAPQVGTQSPHHGVLTPPRGSTGGSFHAEPPSPTACPGPASRSSVYTVQGLPSALLAKVCVPSPISHAAWLGAHEAPALLLAKRPISCAPVERGAPCRTSCTARVVQQSLSGTHPHALNTALLLTQWQLRFPAGTTLQD